ncbi:PEP-CTERM sorting domain-containing protein [Roseomonas sp. AR75]|uniref:PEP-CTERM sorting domain-containing protein n=1 Tax=Roseomonas sp. AR75 TaxID=2562311 RepID=UPI0010C0C875|nr:PEP-CTERM sorting domain-containing protein [Roseomonas sp. AR75]
MRPVIRVLGAALLATALLYGNSTSPQAAPILQVTIDTPTRGRAVLAGDITRGDIRRYELVTSGAFWSYEATVTIIDGLLGTGDESVSLLVKARHLVAVHPGEAHPALLLTLPIAYFANRTPPDFVDESGPARSKTSVLHPGSDEGHQDRLVLTLDDLNGVLPGFVLSGVQSDQISARLDVAHIPEPGSIAILLAGLAGTAALRRWRRQG